jgi:hypothetical protein
MVKPVRITDHALIRYLERVKGVDVEALRREIAQVVARGHELGASAVRTDGFTYRIEAGRVVTIHPQCRPSLRFGSRPRMHERRDDE